MRIVGRGGLEWLKQAYAQDVVTILKAKVVVAHIAINFMGFTAPQALSHKHSVVSAEEILKKTGLCVLTVVRGIESDKVPNVH